MSIVLVTTLVLGLLVQAPNPAAPATASNIAQVETTTRALLTAFAAMDAAAMKDHFADKVLFIGEPRFVGEGRGRPVQRQLTRDELAGAFARLFAAMDRQKWTEVNKVLTPTLTRAERPASHPNDTDGFLPADFVKPGEFLYELKAPGSGLDDVLLFVLRSVDGKWRVVAHWGDY